MLNAGNPAICAGVATLATETKEASESRNFSDFDIYSNAINDSWSAIKGHVFSIGQNLEDAFRAIKEKKQRATWNAWVEQKLPFSQSTAEKLRRIYKKQLLRENQDRLPAEWATLNQLAQISDATLKGFIDSGTVHPKMTREDASKLRGKKPAEFILASPKADWAVDKVRRYREMLVLRIEKCDAILEKATPIAVNQ